MSLSRRHLATAALAAGAVSAGWLAWAGQRRQAAPAVRFTLLDGQQMTLQQLQGRVVLVNFWATTCSVCVGEMPALAATHERYRARGFDTIAVSMAYDAPAAVSMFAEAHRLPFGVAIDNTGEIARRFGNVAVTPTTFLIDRRGRIVQRRVGAPDVAALRAQVAQLLAEA